MDNVFVMQDILDKIAHNKVNNYVKIIVVVMVIVLTDYVNVLLIGVDNIVNKAWYNNV